MANFRKIADPIPPSELANVTSVGTYANSVVMLDKIYRSLATKTFLSPAVDTLEKITNNIRNMLNTEPTKTLKLAHSITSGLPYISQHAVNVSIISLHIGLKLELTPPELKDLGISSLLHCIGRPIGIEDEIHLGAKYLKTKTGYVESVDDNLAKVEKITDKIRNIIKTHHKAMGPNNYPYEFSQDEDMGICEKILIIVDCYVTMLQHPIIKEGYYPYTTLMWIVDHDGKPFESEVLKALVDTVGLYPIGSWLELSTGEIGEVVSPNLGNPMRPLLKVLFNSSRKPLAQTKIVDLSENNTIQVKKIIPESELPVPVLS